MGRQRVSTATLDMRGSFVKHPDRIKEREFEPRNLPPLGEFPARLGELVREAWNDIVKYAPAGVMTSADTVSVELCAVLLAAHRTGKITSADRGQLITLLGKFGMNPSDRSRVQVVKSANVKGKREKYLN